MRIRCAARSSCNSAPGGLRLRAIAVCLMMFSMPPIARLAALAHNEGPDFAAVVEKLRRSCGTNTYDLAVVLEMKPRQLIQIESGDREPTWSEGDLLLRALDLCRKDNQRLR
jgi:DNA-binding XRE family transcriptional regulator